MGKAEQTCLASNEQGAIKFDDLAKTVISKQMTSGREARDIEPLVASREEVVAKLKDGLNRVHSKPDELKTKHDQPVAHAETVEI